MNRAAVRREHDELVASLRAASGISVPERRRIAKAWARAHESSPPEDVLEMVDSLFASQSYEEKTFGALLVDYHGPARLATGTDRIDVWLSRLAGWAEVDSLCQNVFQADQLLADWRAWKTLIARLSRDPNVNKRRASLVLLTGPVHYSDDARLSELAFATVDTLSAERDPLITKAVSWLLRSLIENHRTAVVHYLDEHEPTLPRIAVRETRVKLETGTKSGRRRQSPSS
jgi:3-methyladenine DNA glycosylase AlkD